MRHHGGKNRLVFYSGGWLKHGLFHSEEIVSSGRKWMKLLKGLSKEKGQK